jgi:CheY-like chemotaxis protein
MAMPSILIVDASQAARIAVTELLRDYGYGVQAACDAREAEHLMDALVGEPCLALLDFRSLHGRATSLTNRLRQRWPELPIVFLTGVLPSEDDALGQALSAATTAVLVKPTSIDSILACIDPRIVSRLEHRER